MSYHVIPSTNSTPGGLDVCAGEQGRATAAVPYAYRADGWPLCPACGEDELMSHAVTVHHDDELFCAACGWYGRVPVR